MNHDILLLFIIIIIVIIIIIQINFDERIEAAQKSTSAVDSVAAATKSRRINILSPPKSTSERKKEEFPRTRLKKYLYLYLCI